MNLYRNIATGEFSGTMSLAKAIGPFIPVDVPVDKAGLIAYLNDNNPVQPESSEPITLPDPPQVIIPPTSEVKEVIDYNLSLRECIKHASIRDVAEVIGLFMNQYVNESDEDSKLFPTSKVYTMTCEEKTEVTESHAPDQGEDQPVEEVIQSTTEE
jgi:hypothetical protein